MALLILYRSPISFLKVPLVYWSVNEQFMGVICIDVWTGAQLRFLICRPSNTLSRMSVVFSLVSYRVAFWSVVNPPPPPPPAKLV